MRGTQGAMIIASTLQIVLGFSGLWRNVTRLLSPLSAAPLVALSGFGLYELGFPVLSKCIEIGLPECSGGLTYLQFCNLNSFRVKFILGFSIFMGLSIPQYFNEYTAINHYGPVHTGARWFNDMINVPFSSEAFVAGLLAYTLDVTLDKKDNAMRKDRGMHFWDKFRSFKTDARSEEFYSLPFNFPSV